MKGRFKINNKKKTTTFFLNVPNLGRKKNGFIIFAHQANAVPKESSLRSLDTIIIVKSGL